MRRLLLLVLPLIVIVLIGFVGVSTMSGSGSSVDEGAAPAAGAGAVTIEGFEFGPADLTVAAGTEVTWTNQDGSPHSIQDDSGEDLFAESDELSAGDTFSFAFEQPGEYAYFCGVHNYMQGTVTVSG